MSCRFSGTVQGENKVGGIAGNVRHQDGEIRSCLVSGGITGKDDVGGLVGYHRTGRIMGCGYEGQVTGTGEGVGGVAGTFAGSLVGCSAKAAVHGTRDVGGLIGKSGISLGHLGFSANLYANYAHGTVIGETNIAGLIGSAIVSGRFEQCYAACHVQGIELAGGLIASANSKFISTVSSFWDSQISRQANSAGGIGKSTAELMDPDVLRQAGWDFSGSADGPSNIWALPSSGGYPLLWWQVDKPDLGPEFAQGKGTTDDPYGIATSQQLNAIGHNPLLMRACFRINQEVDLQGNAFAPIGHWAFPYRGTFDGQGFTILHLTITSSESSRKVGMFAALEGPEMHIRNLVLEDPNVQLEDLNEVGVLAGRVTFGQITNCHVEGGLVAGQNSVGLLVGWNQADLIKGCTVEGVVQCLGGGAVGGLIGTNYRDVEDCHAVGIIAGDSHVGGLVGAHNRGTLSSCSASVQVSGRSSIGGLVGRNSTKSIVYGSFAEGKVSGDWAVGGLVGNNDNLGSDPEDMAVINACYAQINVTGDRSVGGLVGRNRGAIMTSFSTGKVMGQNETGGLVGGNPGGHVYLSFWDMESSAMTTSTGGRGKAHQDMLAAETYRGWGVEPIWTLDAGDDYPRLAWQGHQGEPLVVAPALYTEGSGTPEDPYQISTAAQWCDIAYQRNHFSRSLILMNSIDLAGWAEQLVPIGCAKVPFTGQLNGNGFAIENLAIDRVGNYTGLIAFLSRERLDCQPTCAREPVYRVGMIQDLTLRDVNVTGRTVIGALAGYGAGVIRRCSVTGLVRGEANVGGLVGYQVFNGQMQECFSNATIEGQTTVGGLLGSNKSGHVSDCYAVSTVYGGTDVGGLVGYHRSSVLETSYFSGTLGAGTNRGGLIGRYSPSYPLSIVKCVWNTETAGVPQAIGSGTANPAEAFGVTTALMRNVQTYLDAGWNFSDVWMICDGQDSPRLRWEQVECE